MRTLLIALLLGSCDAKDADSASGADDSTPGGDDSATDDSAPPGDLDGDGVDAPNDCNDGDASIFPGADEIIADGIDQDCDGLDLCYVDDDLDGYGDATISAEACDVEGLSATGGDCDDADVAYHPGAKESCDEPFDYNCDDSVDYTDDDKDGWAACEECNDTDGDVRPDGVEVAADGVDQDCDGGDACFADEDGDGFGGAATVASADLDCSDAGEGSTDEDCLDSGDGAAATWPGTAFEDSSTECMTDADGDGYGALVPATGVSAGSDCNDAAAEVHPGGTEIPGDGIDSDCDTTETCYYDADGDGYGGAKTVSSTDTDCTDAGEAATPSDCDDSDPKLWCDIRVGNDVEFPDSSSHSPDYLLGSLLTVPSDMTVTALALIGKSATGNVRMALYTDSSGAPDALVVETGSTAVPVGVLEIPVKSTAIPAGAYWIMAVFDVTASVGISYPKFDVVQYRSLLFSDPMPGTFGSPSTYTGQIFNYYIVGY